MPLQLLKLNRKIQDHLPDILFALLVVLALFLCQFFSGCNRKTTPVVITDTQVIVRDCVITIPADTHQLFLKWSELCDTTKQDTVFITAKDKRKTIQVQRIGKDITIICREDSLVKIIEQLRKQTTNVIQQPKKDYKILFYSLLLFSFALVLFAIKKLIS